LRFVRIAPTLADASEVALEKGQGQLADRYGASVSLFVAALQQSFDQILRPLRHALRQYETEGVSSLHSHVQGNLREGVPASVESHAQEILLVREALDKTRQPGQGSVRSRW
jgi:hypothetical protein